MRKLSTLRFLMICLLGIISINGLAQTVIGSFPQFDGGFEGQATGTLTTLSSIANGVQRTDWTVSAGAGSALISASNGRSGPKYLTVGATSATARRYQSPTASNGAVANATAYTIQFYYKTSASTSFSNGQANASPDGTGNPGTYQALTLSGTSGTWTKIQQAVTTGTSANATKYGISIFRISAVSGIDADIDDWVMYAGAADNTAPTAPGTVTASNATASSLDVSWTAATGGVDGGGYVVVRYTTSPNADNDPNQNGIYAIGNTTNNGTGSLVGTIAYIGTGTNFSDVGLTSSKNYYYKVYTVDKAFNYSTESEGSGTTSTPASPTLSLNSSLTDFGNVCINTIAGPNSFTVDGNNLDGSNISIATLPGFTYSESSNGSFTSTLSFSYTGSSFSGKVIYVKFAPTSVQAYDGDIILSGGGVSNYAVPAKGTGVSVTAITGTTSTSGTSVTLNGSIGNSSCGTVSSYGFEYSPNSGFANGTGTPVSSSNLSGGNFSATISGLIANKRYYFKAYATSNAVTSYGTQVGFNAPPVPVVMSAQTGLSYTEDFADIANWASFFAGGTGSEHFSQAISTGAGAIPSPTNVTSNAVFSTGSSGGVQRGTDQLTPTTSIVLLSTGSPDNTTSAAFDFYMDFTGLNAGTLSFDYQTIYNSPGTIPANDTRPGSLTVYGTTDGVNYTELTSASVLNFINNVPISGSKNNITLPASFNNSATARLRFYYYNGTTNSGSGSRPKISIDNLNVTAVATTPCTTPTAQPSSMTFGTITDNSIQGSFTAASPASDQYLTIVSVNSTLNSTPTDGIIYNAGDAFGDATVAAKGSSTSFTATGLSASTTYYFFTFAVNGVCTGGPLYNGTNPLTGSATTIAGLPSCTAPVSQPSSLVFSNVNSNSLQGSFTATAADEYLVLKTTSSSLSATPVNGHVYNIGDALGNATVIQRNAATTFTATGLSANTQYYFFIFSLNSLNCINGPTYNSTSPLTGSQTTQPLPPCIAPSSQATYLTLTPSNTSISGTFNASAGTDDYLVIRSTLPTLSGTPTDNTDYATGSAFGGGIVIANSSALSFVSNNLTPGTTYYFFIFSANKNCSGGTKYATGSPLSGGTTTTVALVNNYYFGNLHSHSDYSDGNEDHPGYTPTDDYTYAKTAQCMDFLGISEHNHFSSANSPGNTITNYHKGPTEAANFTAANPGFLALYGMEWGVISGGGHVVVYGDRMDKLFGWESGSGPWGPTDNYDVYVPKNTYVGPTGLFKTINDYVSQNTFATLAHPNSSDFNNISTFYKDTADNAIVGVAIESGPAFSTNTTYSNPAPISYVSYFQTLLSKGYHLGPTIDHDNHNTTFGHTTYSRTAVISSALTQSAIIKAMRDMHFYATEDCDSKVDFTINTRIMGSIFSDRNSPAISVTLTDATTTTTSAIIRVMFGLPGSGALPVKIDSVIGNTLYFVDNNLSNGSTGYYYVDITNGSTRILTSPIWYTRTDVATPPAVYYRSKQTGDWSDVNTWESSADNSTWNNATSTPDYNSSAINIRNGNTVNVSTSVTTDHTFVNPGGILTVGTSATLSVINIGLTLQSSATGTAIIGNSAGSISGNVIVERFISAASARSAWRLLTAPLSGTTNNDIFSNWQNGGVNTAGRGTTVTGPTYTGGGVAGSPVSNSTTGLDYNTPGFSLKSFDMSSQSLSGVSNTKTAPLFTTKNNSYFMFINGDRLAYSGNANTTTLSATGNLQMGPITFPTSTTADAFALIGNPYASPVDLHSFNQNNNTSNIKPSYYYWDPYLTGTYGVGGYVTVSYDANGNNELITPEGGGSASTAETRHLQSGQAMFVQTVSSGLGTATVTFTENQKSTTNVNNIFRTQGGNIETLRVNLNMISSGNSLLLDGIVAGFDKTYSATVDNYDAAKFYNIGESISFIRDNKVLSIERRPLIKSEDVLYLNLSNVKAGIDYQFEFTPDLNVLGVNAWLKDNYLNTTTAIDVNAKTTINFVVNNSAASKGANRFSIVFNKPAIVSTPINPSISVYPNPVINGKVQLQFTNMPQGTYTVKVLNTLGQVITTKIINHAEGSAIESMQIPKGVKGVYQVEITKPDNTKSTNKIIAN